MKVKICGNTNRRDALAAAELGADFVGAIVEVPVDTPRKVTAQEAKEILADFPSPVGRVIVIMPKTIGEAAALYEEIRPEFVQLHGSEDVQFVRELCSLIPCKIIKTIHVKDKASIQEAKKFARYSDALLLDTPSKQLGGSGKTHDRQLSRKIVEAVSIPVILAGGLTPENVAESVRIVKPYAVDVSSGVEKKEGKKDYSKVKKFIKNAKLL
ncbi:MAG: phosphoribosylanthranilate isomerase [Euryarchaeota archaeon]|nr:phosphoribosylanthranilate isomerase [Euryarchaeota archaeon]